LGCRSGRVPGGREKVIIMRVAFHAEPNELAADLARINPCLLYGHRIR
jgi:hypothetical protein